MMGNVEKDLYNTEAFGVRLIGGHARGENILRSGGLEKDAPWRKTSERETAVNEY